MKRASILLVALASLVPLGASAGDRTIPSSLSVSFDEPVRMAERYDVGDAEFAITTHNRKVVLLLTDRVVAMQLSDRVLRKADRKMRDAEYDGADNAIDQAVKSAVLAGVRSLLSHSAECDIRDIAAVDYRRGELILTARNGQRIFANTDVDDDDVMRDFSQSDARSFVRELRRRMARER